MDTAATGAAASSTCAAAACCRHVYLEEISAEVGGRGGGDGDLGAPEDDRARERLIEDDGVRAGARIGVGDFFAQGAVEATVEQTGDEEGVAGAMRASSSSGG